MRDEWRLPTRRGCLELPVVALPGVGYIPAPGGDEKEAAQVFCVGAATRATQRLVMGVSGDGGVGRALSISPATALGLIATRV
jgi:hypothetical protein